MGDGILHTLKLDSKEAAYRVAGTQIIKAVKTGILKILRSRGFDNKHINNISNYLDTEVGSAILSTVVGLMFAYFPIFKNDERAQTIAKEFRVGGMALAGNLLADKAFEELFPAINNILESLPIPKIPLLSKPKVRVSESSTINQEAEEETEIVNNPTTIRKSFNC